jgi:hypothetical protein
MKEETEALLRKFKPQFGNKLHISDLSQIEKVQKLDERVKGIRKRRIALESAIKTQSKTEEKLVAEEALLFAALSEQ